MFTEAKSDIFDGAFFTSVKPYFKIVLNSIELPLHNAPFSEKTYNCEQ